MKKFYFLIFVLFLTTQLTFGQTPYSMSSGNYSEDFANISNTTNWPNGFNGTDCTEWGYVIVSSAGTIPDGIKTTVSTATFTTSTAGGVQRGTGNIILLSTGSTDNTSACAIDLYLDFTGRVAGTISFDWAEVNNSTGDRTNSLRVYTSTDGTTFTELSGAAVLNVVNNVASSGSITNISLPSSFNNSPTARIRFYEYNGTGGTTGSRAKISIDNISVTSTSSGDTPTKLVVTSINGGSSPTVNTPFDVVVQSQDNSNVPQNVSENTDISLSVATGTGSLGGTITGTILAGQSSVTISGTTYNTVESGVSLTATRTSGDILTPGTSSAFSVLDAASQLAFVNVPSSGQQGVNLSSFTVEARRPDNSVDITYTGSITIDKDSGPGAISGTLTKSAVAGVAIFNDVKFDQTGTYTISASATGLTGTTSGSIVISVAPSVSINLRPSYIDLSATTSQCAVLVTVANYSSDDARYRLYNGLNQFNCWDPATSLFVTSNSYASGPQIPGTPSSSSTWWILFQRGNNNSVDASYRDRLGSAYSANYQTQALPAATSMSSIFNLTGSVTAGGGYDLTVKYVVLGFDAVLGGNLLCAASTDLTTGNYTLACDGSSTIRRVEFRTINNTIITSITNATGWTSNTSIGSTPLPVELSSFSASVVGNAVKLNWKTETEVNNFGFDIERSLPQPLPKEGAFGTPLPLGKGQGDGLWTKIGFVNGNGNSNSPKSYSFTDTDVLSGKYSYRLKQIDNDGKFEYSKVIEVDLGTPTKFELAQNFPNPFNPETAIRFTLPTAGNVRLTIYNLLGQEVKSLVNAFKEAGTHIINFNASEFNSGVYIYKLEANGITQTRKMTLIK